MTAHDPRSRPAGGHDVPLDDIAPTRLAEDVQPHDADALDAWLDSLAPVDAVNAGHNGHPNGRAPHRREAEASRTAAEGSPLVAIAREFHARFADAEAAHAVDIPETVIWERIMSSQLTMQQPASTSGRPAPQPTRPEVDGEPHPTPIVDRFIGGHPAVSAVLAAAVILAIVAIFRVIGAPPSGPGEEPTVAPVPNANPGLAASPYASPVASPVVSNDKWLVDPDAAACAVDPANPPGAVDGEWMGSASNAGLLPFSDTTSGNRTAAAEVYLQFRICRDDEVVTDLLVTHAFAEGFAEDSALPPERLARDLALGQEISEADADREPMSFVIEGEPLPRDFSSPGYGSSSRPVLLPDDVVQLADGRIGGPTHEFFQTNDPGGAASYLAPAGYLETGFVIFAVENGRWVIDEFLPICLGDCDAYWAAREAESTPVTGGPETGDLASLGASGSLIVGDEAQGQSQLVRVPLGGGMPDPLPVSGYSSAIRTAQSDVVILDDAQGNQVAHNVATGITSKTFSTRNIASVANVGPYRIIGYTDPVDLLIVDLRTMRLTMLSDLTGGSIGISNPAFSVQGDESGNLLVGVTRADDPGTTSAVAAFIDGDTGQARILDGWTAPGDSAVAGAIAPDGASIAYPADKDGVVVLRTESVEGEPIRDYEWDTASRIYRMAFVNPTDMVVFSATPVDGGIAPGADGPASSGTVATIRVFAGEADVQTVASLGGVANLQGPFISPDGGNVLFARDATIEGVEQPVWYMLNVESGQVTELLELRGMATTLSFGDPVVRELVPLARSRVAGPGVPLGDMSIFWATFDLAIGKTRADTDVMTVDGRLVDTSDHLVVAGLDPQTVTQQEGTGDEQRVLFRSDGAIVVTDGAIGASWSKPLPDVGADWIIPTALVLSPDGRHIALSAYGSDESMAASRTWVTSLAAGAPWIEVGPYTLHEWTGTPDRERASAQTAAAHATPVAAPAATPAAQAAIPLAPEDGTLLIDNGSGIVSRPLDGSAGTTLVTGPPPITTDYSRTTVPDVVISSDGKTAQNARTGQVLGTNPYDGSMVIGPFWVQHTAENPSHPVDARIVDLRTMEIVEFFDLAGVDPAGLGPQWLIEGTESDTLGVGFVDRAYGTGPTLTPTMLLIDGDLERTRVVSLWSPRGTDGDVLAFSPDGSTVAYLTGTEGNVVVRVETLVGEPIGDVPWPAMQPIEHLVLPDARTLLVMSEGKVLRVDLATGTKPVAIAEYTGAVRDAVLSPNGSHLLFATFDRVSETNGNEDTAWHWLDIGTGDMRQITQATTGGRIAAGPSLAAEVVMLYVPIDRGPNTPFKVLFVDVATGAVKVASPTIVIPGSTPGEPVSADGTVFATYGAGSPEAPRYAAEDVFGSIPLNGQLMVFDAASGSVVEIPFPDIPAPEITPSLIVSPDGRHVVLSVRWTDVGGEHAQSWITTSDGGSGWTLIEGGLVIGWVGE
jgi:hypothetical protein